MVITRTEAKSAYDHVMDVVLDRYGSKDLKDALVEEGFVDLFQVLTINDEDIEGLVYQDPADPSKTIPIQKGDVGMLKCYGLWVIPSKILIEFL